MSVNSLPIEILDLILEFVGWNEQEEQNKFPRPITAFQSKDAIYCSRALYKIFQEKELTKEKAMLYNSIIEKYITSPFHVNTFPSAEISIPGSWIPTSPQGVNWDVLLDKEQYGGYHTYGVLWDSFIQMVNCKIRYLRHCSGCIIFTCMNEGVMPRIVLLFGDALRQELCHFVKICPKRILNGGNPGLQANLSLPPYIPIVPKTFLPSSEHPFSWFNLCDWCLHKKSSFEYCGVNDVEFHLPSSIPGDTTTDVYPVIELGSSYTEHSPLSSLTPGIPQVNWKQYSNLKYTNFKILPNLFFRSNTIFSLSENKQSMIFNEKNTYPKFTTLPPFSCKIPLFHRLSTEANVNLYIGFGCLNLFPYRCDQFDSLFLSPHSKNRKRPFKRVYEVIEIDE